MVADGLSRKTESAPIRDVFLRMKVISPLLDMIKEAQEEGLKREEWKIEWIRGKISLFDRDSHGLLT